MMNNRSTPSCPARPPHAAVGMTLIEMLVSVSILTVMILAFSTILVQSQRVISVSQTSRRSHAMAFAIARVIRSDFRRITQNGFLAICNRTGSEDPLMVFTTAGTTQGAASDARGAGSLVCYGLCSNSSSTNGHRILWRPQYILSQFAPGQNALSLNGGGTPPQPERMNLELANIQVFPRRETSSTPSVIDSIVEIPIGIPGLIPTGTSTLRVPPKNGSDLGQLWQALVTDCSDLTITWTDGVSEAVVCNGASMKNDLRWFGIDRKVAATITPALTQPRWSGIADTEETDTKYSGTFSYYALFTHDNQKVWPRAVKIRFTIYEKGMPAEFVGTNGTGGMEYEVICNIGE